jgi:TetR/AcrR family acrAB operon transcriptional repressor
MNVSERTLMRRKKEDALLTRDTILDAGLRVFSRNGYALSTLEDIAKEAKVTRGAIYWHFENKVEIYAALVGERSSKAFAMFNEVMNKKTSPVQKLRQLLTQSLIFLEENAEYRALLELTTFKTEVTEEMVPFIQQKVENNRRLVASFMKLVEEGRTMGEMRSDIDPNSAALAIMGFLNGILLSWLTDPRAFSPKEQAETIVETFLHGLLPQ